MKKQPTCDCLQESAEHICNEIDFFYDQDNTVSIECCFYNETSETQEDVELQWNFCPQCGNPLEEVTHENRRR